MKYTIATAESRKATAWHNREVTWGELKKLLQHRRTPYTLPEYQALPKEQQSEVKDVGGYVGGELIEDGGRRRDDNLATRTLLTLDIDKAKAVPSINKKWSLILHSTHSHTEEAPSFRVIVPLSRPATPLEYQAVAHRVAEEIGLTLVDPASFKPSQMMYWAAAPKEAPIVYHAQDGEPLDVDAILSHYHNWADPNEWATTENPYPKGKRLSPAKVHTLGAKQGNPREKQNIVGAWCRTYSVTDVLDMFPETYGYAGRNAYSYLLGSTRGGVAIYDEGDFCYSYHATDPLREQLLNSWDLYRLLAFSHLDYDAAPTTRTDRLPSSAAMRQHALEDKRVKQDFLSLNLGAPDTGQFSLVQEENDDWQSELEVTEKGVIVNSLGNFYRILKHDPNLLKGRVRYDEFRRDKIVEGKLAWERENSRVWTDADTAQAALYIEQTYKIKNKNDLQMMLDAVIREDATRFNGVHDFIESVEWDGTPRVDDLFIKYLGVPDTELHRRISRKTILACIARAYEPGIKYDQITVLVGNQGLGKSTLLKKLGGAYFMDSFTMDAKSNKMEEAVVGSWIIEIPELQGFRKADVDAIKAFVSKQQDRFRPAYGRETVEVRRTCVFFATTNDEEFLRDPTGNRRLWILPCGVPQANVFDLTEDDIHQVWAEAKVLWEQGHTTLYLEREDERQMVEIQREYDIDADQVGALEAFLDIKLPNDWDSYEMHERRGYFQALKAGRMYDRGGFGCYAYPSEVRQTISAIEVVNEFFMQDNNRGNILSRNASSLLKKLPGWTATGKRQSLTGGYGQQKTFERK